jgi:hypothetical protein
MWAPVATAWRFIGLRIKEITANIMNKRSRTGGKGWSSSWGLGEVLATPYCKKASCYEMLHRASDLADACGHGDEPSRYIKGGIFLD